MEYLPVPELSGTLERYLDIVAPLLEPDEFERTRAVVAQFAAGDGPACQAELLRFAEAENAAGRSWLSAAWLDGYLSVRGPLPQTTSASLQIRMPAAGLGLGSGLDSGLDRAADVVHRLARVHVAHLRGELPAETNGRGEPVCDQQRFVLGGGLRHPLPGLDEIRPGSPGAASREIGVLVGDRYVAVPISDAAGQVLSRPTLRRLLAEAVRAADRVDAGFTSVSALGSELAAPLLAELLQDAANAAVYARLTDAVFLVDLLDTDEPAGEDGVAHLERLTFGSGAAWAYKPLTYQISLRDEFVAGHMEHTSPDGGTLQAVVALAQADGPAGSADALEHDGGDEGVGSVAALQWRLSPELSARIDEGLATVRAQAAGLRLQVETVDAPDTTHLPYRVSDDAAQQWMFLYAQLATYGRIRSTYESVDMRHTQAGRTECLRPNNPPAVALVRALLAGEATGEHVQAALAAHKDWVRACKTGQGIDRHLLGLQLAAGRLGLTPALYDDPAYVRLKTDFLSTTSLGDQSQVVRTGFAPTSPGGIGIYYSLVPGGYQFLLSRNAQTQRFEEFVANLHAGACAVRELLATL